MININVVLLLPTAWHTILSHWHFLLNHTVHFSLDNNEKLCAKLKLSINNFVIPSLVIENRE
jgi:hypothetical protein